MDQRQQFILSPFKHFYRRLVYPRYTGITS
jgi:hypothetical protein